MRASLLASTALLLVSVGAHADTITNFNFNSDLTGGYTAQGTVSVDTDTGIIQTSNFTLSQNGVIDATFSSPDYSQPVYGVYLAEFPDSTDGYTYELLLGNASLVGYTGGSVCTTTAPCLGYPSGFFLPSGNYVGATDGTLAPTPEPASVLMLATGLGVGVLYSRRRWA